VAPGDFALGALATTRSTRPSTARRTTAAPASRTVAAAVGGGAAAGRAAGFASRVDDAGEHGRHARQAHHQPGRADRQMTRAPAAFARARVRAGR
jgi:hypothetical protein